MTNASATGTNTCPSSGGATQPFTAPKTLELYGGLWLVLTETLFQKVPSRPLYFKLWRSEHNNFCITGPCIDDSIDAHATLATEH